MNNIKTCGFCDEPCMNEWCPTNKQLLELWPRKKYPRFTDWLTIYYKELDERALEYYETTN